MPSAKTTTVIALPPDASSGIVATLAYQGVRRRLWLGRFLIILWFAAPALADDAVLPLREVAPGLFVHAGAIELMSAENMGAIANVGFIVGGEAVAVVDTGGSVREGRALLNAVRSTTDKPIRFVINTHMHPDHVFGNAAFLGSGATFVGAERLAAALAARGDTYLRNNSVLIGEALASEVRIIAPAMLVEETMTLDLGGRKLELRAWDAAHTNNDLTVFDPTTKTLFSGDLVFLEHVPALDGSIKGWLAAIEDLASIPAERVVPGHGPAFAPWPEALAPQRAYLEALTHDIRALVARGARIEEAPDLVGREHRQNWLLFEEFHARNVIAAFAELEWE
jgi:quinoprotein relay system zinc metallohydrolase 2